MAQGDDYIYGQSISSEKMRRWALLDSGYEDVRYDALGRLCYKRKSWVDEELRECDTAAIATDCYFVLRCNETVSLLAGKSGADASRATLSLQGAKKLFKGY